jgi:hypothetical protein
MPADMGRWRQRHRAAKVYVHWGEVLRLRETGWAIEKIAKHMRIGVGTVVRVLQPQPAQCPPSKRPRISSSSTGDSKRASSALRTFRNHQVLEAFGYQKAE